MLLHQNYTEHIISASFFTDYHPTRRSIQSISQNGNDNKSFRNAYSYTIQLPFNKPKAL